MSVSKNNPSSLPEVVLRVWKNRLHIELEASAVFLRLAEGMESLWGAGDRIARLARQAGTEEINHGEMCNEILGTPGRPEPLNYKIQLGPEELSLQNQVLYTCVSMSCITETLSTALLIEMQKLAKHEVIRKTVHKILNDEVRHSRIGWAEIARSAHQDLRWMGKFVPEMIDSALTTEIGPMLSPEEALEDFTPWGVLSPKRSRELMEETIENVVVPGLQQYKIL